MPATEQAVSLALLAADGATDVKATDLAILDVADLLAIVDLFVLATTTSDRQLKAAADSIEDRLRDQDRKPRRREGSAATGWLLLDYGDVVCHLFSAEQRELYGLERLWADVPQRDPQTGEVLGQPGAARVDDAPVIGR